jgi:hypothetical protein
VPRPRRWTFASASLPRRRKPSETAVRQWALEDREGFSEKYARAREIGYHKLADELLEISDDGTNDWVECEGEDGTKAPPAVDHEHIARSKLRVDTRKWLLSKCLPKIYGEKLEIRGDKENPVSVKVQVDEFLAELDRIATRQREIGPLIEAEPPTPKVSNGRWQ